MKKRIFLISFLFFLLLTFSSCKSEEQGIIINEVMASNKSTYTDENGDFCDWIELYNASSSAINLDGYMLSDDRYDKDVFTFPSVTLAAGEYLVVFADSKNYTDAQNSVFHLPFSVSSKGECIYLYSGDGKLQSLMNTNVLSDDESIGINEKGKLQIFNTPTPGKPNSENVQSGADKALLDGIYINEYSTSSTQTVTDEDGEFVSFVEIYNSSDKDVDLKGCRLTDDYKDKEKWTFPSVTVKAKGYLVVYLSGKTKVYDGKNLHADFVLSGKEDTVYLLDAKGKTLDSVKVYELISNLTYGRSKDDLTKFLFFSKATAGKANTANGFESIDSARYTKNKSLCVTEVAAVNNTVAQSENGEYFDYVELYNSSGKTVNLKNYKLSDSKKAESFLSLPDKELKSGEYVVIYCGDDNYTSSVTGNIYRKFGLNRYGETVYIVDKDGTAVDSFSYGRLSSSYSAGRDITKTDETVYYNALTPGKENPKTSLKAALPNAQFSKSSTYVEKGEKIEISCQNGEIRYTTDGSVPNENSKLYTEAITINKNTVIRAKVFLNGYVPSDCVNATYITGRKSKLDVVFLTTDSDNLYGYSNGIFADGPNKSSEFPYLGANFWQDWEREVNFEYMTADGVSQIQFDAGIKVFGQYSRALSQKSVSINLRDKYGPTEVCYPFFDDSDVNVFSSLVLRNSGQDFQKSHIRDAFCAMVMKNSVDVDIMDYKPVVTYINGEYYGIYDLREKLDEDYLANHHGIDSENVDFIKGNSIVQNGSVDAYKELLEYIKTHDMSKKENYEYACKQIDIDELISYWMCESFFTNTDTGNIRFYKENTENAKWRWIFFDADWALYPSTYKWNYVDNYLNPEGHGVGRMFNTTIMVNLMKNSDFRKRVLEIHSKHLKTTFDTNRMLKIYDSMVNEIREEMKYHCEKWNGISYEGWEKSINELRTIIEEKKEIFISHIIESFNMTDEEIKMYLE